VPSPSVAVFGVSCCQIAPFVPGCTPTLLSFATHVFPPKVTTSPVVYDSPLSQAPRCGPLASLEYEAVGAVPIDHTETAPATPTKPPPIETAYDCTFLIARALTRTSALAQTSVPVAR
jgi:hypothetical protein